MPPIPRCLSLPVAARRPSSSRLPPPTFYHHQSPPTIAHKPANHVARLRSTPSILKLLRLTLVAIRFPLSLSLFLSLVRRLAPIAPFLPFALAYMCLRPSIMALLVSFLPVFDPALHTGALLISLSSLPSVYSPPAAGLCLSFAALFFSFSSTLCLYPT